MFWQQGWVVVLRVMVLQSAESRMPTWRVPREVKQSATPKREMWRDEM